MPYSILKTYIANVLIGLTVILLASQFGPAYAIGAFVLAAGSFYFTRRLAQEAEKAAKKALQFEVSSCRAVHSIGSWRSTGP